MVYGFGWGRGQDSLDGGISMETTEAVEPKNLREWRPRSPRNSDARLFTCGRPGRAVFDRDRVAVPEDVIDAWFNGLPQAGELHLISLLGRKRDGYSEFSYYPFRSSLERNDKPPFESWLERYSPRVVVVHEFQTVDAMGVPAQTLDAAVACAENCLRSGHTTVVVDSAGSERTSRVCERLGFEPLNAEANLSSSNVREPRSAY
jgi:hypothetical protein